MDWPHEMRQNFLRHGAGKGTASDKESSREIPFAVPTDGDGADEGLSQRLGAGGRAWRPQDDSVSVAASDGALESIQRQGNVSSP
jgi:hypothetical protein